jgi:hypothetical protein
MPALLTQGDQCGGSPAIGWATGPGLGEPPNSLGGQERREGHFACARECGGASTAFVLATPGPFRAVRH